MSARRAETSFLMRSWSTGSGRCRRWRAARSGRVQELTRRRGHAADRGDHAGHAAGVALGGEGADSRLELGQGRLQILDLPAPQSTCGAAEGGQVRLNVLHSGSELGYRARAGPDAGEFLQWSAQRGDIGAQRRRGGRRRAGGRRSGSTRRRTASGRWGAGCAAAGAASGRQQHQAGQENVPAGGPGQRQSAHSAWACRRAAGFASCTAGDSAEVPRGSRPGCPGIWKLRRPTRWAGTAHRGPTGRLPGARRPRPGRPAPRSRRRSRPPTSAIRPPNGSGSRRSWPGAGSAGVMMASLGGRRFMSGVD